MGLSRVAARENALDFESFFQIEYEHLFRGLCLTLGDVHEAEEVAQEAFAIAWERWDRVAGMESPAGYVFRVAVNTSRRRFRRALFARKHVELPLTQDQFARVDDEDEASRALTCLPHQQRSAIVLTSYLGYSSEEAAAILRIKASTVRVLTSRARSTLRAALAERGHE
jgi:RNA polymerase sigma factor (sigma-70 family)